MGESISMNHQRSKKGENSRREEVVATGEALQLAAQWLGLNEKDVDKTYGTTKDIETGLGQYAGLGYGKKKKSSSKNMWKLEERLSGTLSQSSNKRKYSAERLGHHNDGQKQGHIARVQGRREEDEEEEEEENGRSKVFSSSKVGASKNELLLRPSHTGSKKKK